MKRREFIAGLGGAVAWPLTARGQTAPVVGYLSTLSAVNGEPVETAFRQGLGKAGFTDGRNVSIEYRYAEGQIGRLPALAEDLVRRRVAVIAAMGGSRSAVAASPRRRRSDPGAIRSLFQLMGRSVGSW